MEPENCGSYLYLKGLGLDDDTKTELIQQMGCEIGKCYKCKESLKDVYRNEEQR